MDKKSIVNDLYHASLINVCQMFADSISWNDFYFIFDGFANDQINKISWDGGCHAWGRSGLLCPETWWLHWLATDVPFIACVINLPYIFLPITWSCPIFSSIL